MPNVERQLISRIIARPEELPSVLRQNVRAYHFHDDGLRDVWEYIVEYYGEYGQAPDQEAIRLEVGNFRYGKPANPTQFYIDRLLDDHRKIRTKEMLSEAISAVRDTEDEPGDHEAALKIVHDQIVLIEQETSLTEDRDTSDLGPALDRYKEIQDHGVGYMIGIPTGFPMIDEATSGLRPEQFIVLAGPQKAGKSSLMVAMAKKAQESGKKVVFFSFEMSNQEQEDRYISLLAKVSLPDMTHGKLTPENWVELRKAKLVAEGLNPITWSHDMRRTATLAGVEAKIDQYKPDIVFIDGIYMMDSEVVGKTSAEWESLTVLSRGAKRMAQNLKICIVASTQALESKMSKRRGIETSSIGYSSSFGQDADLIIGLEKADMESNIAPLKIMDARNVARNTTAIRFDWTIPIIEEIDREGSDLGDIDDDI